MRGLVLLAFGWLGLAILVSRTGQLLARTKPLGRASVFFLALLALSLIPLSVAQGFHSRHYVGRRMG